MCLGHIEERRGHNSRRSHYSMRLPHWRRGRVTEGFCKKVMSKMNPTAPVEIDKIEGKFISCKTASFVKSAWQECLLCTTWTFHSLVCCLSPLPPYGSGSHGFDWPSAGTTCLYLISNSCHMFCFQPRVSLLMPLDPTQGSRTTPSEDRNLTLSGQSFHHGK